MRPWKAPSQGEGACIGDRDAAHILDPDRKKSRTRNAALRVLMFDRVNMATIALVCIVIRLSVHSPAQYRYRLRITS